MALEFFDTHCHLNNVAYPDPAATIAEAKASGVTRLTIIGLDLKHSQMAIDIAEQHEGVYATAGWHPSYSATYSDGALVEIQKMLSHPKVVAIGETGLDRGETDATAEQQLNALHAQLELNRDLGMPMVFHSRGKESALLDILERQPNLSGVMHCFGGTLDEAKRAIELGMFLGFDGPVTFKNGEELRKLVAQLPLDKIVIETDSPYLTPHPHRGTPNHPKYVRLVAQSIAEACRLTLDEVASQTTANAKRLYRLD